MTIYKNRVMVIIILSVCASIMPQLFFKNGFLLSYLLKLGFQSSDVLMLLSFPSGILFLSAVPLAYCADRVGKKKVGVTGIALTIAGYGLIMAAGWFRDPLSANVLILGIVLFSIGMSALISGWFALLSPIIPETIRGTFFGTMRMSWQIFAIGCSFLLTFILERNTSVGTYQLLLSFFICLLVVQILLYSRIPEIEKNDSLKPSIRDILAEMLTIPGYMPFCAYCFLLMLATGAWPVTLGLLEKNVLGFSDDTIVHMGTMMFAGAMAGFYAGGKLVDRIGTKLVFLVVHFSFFLFLFLVLARDLVPFSLVTYFSFLTICLGGVQAASSIALTSEMMALAPIKNKSVILSVCTSLQLGGTAISGMVSSKLIAYGIVSRTWIFNGLTLSNYDTLVLFSAVMVFVFIVTLGLIPSVVKTTRDPWESSKPL